jgi:hypothetical protein
MIAIVTGAMVVAYSLYAFPGGRQKLGTENLGLTIPFVPSGSSATLPRAPARVGENPRWCSADLPILDVLLWAVAGFAPSTPGGDDASRL